MLINPDEVVTGALVNAIAVVGRQVSKAAAGLRKTDDALSTARWFETFRLTATRPDHPDLSPVSWDRLAVVLSGDEIQGALQELLAARLTDAPQTDASRARDAVRIALTTADADTAAFAEALLDYYDHEICALVARLEGQDPPLLAQIRSEAFSSRMISVLHAIEHHTASLAEHGPRRNDSRTVDRRAGNDLAGRRAVGAPAGRVLAEVTDPFALEVHHPVQVDDPPPGLPVLPVYMTREHDRQLAEAVRAAAEGTSEAAVLVGGSSTGKTRACWEALSLLRDRPERWRLWHPIDPSRPEAALRELPSISPHTVVWLNEAQFYLDVPTNGLGERIAAGLRELLRNPARAPVLVLATLWPQFWDRLTARPPASTADPHAQARELLAGRDVSVPAAFTAVQLQQLAAAGDLRLARAAEAAEDGRIIQFLAGAPELMARYRNAPPAAAALMTAAIDARRLGMGIALPLAFLEAAAPGYMTASQWDELDDDWLDQALAYTSAPCKGIRGPLARIRPRPLRTTFPVAGSGHRLADYLDQHGRRTRRHIPPSDFWAAAARFADHGDLSALADAAEARGLLRDAARLRKHAAAHGDTSTAATLVKQWQSLNPYPSNARPAWWVAEHAALAEPGAVAMLLDALREAAAEEQAAALLARDPAAHAALDHPGAVAQLLDALRNAGAAEQASLLADRATAHVALDDPGAIAQLLNALRKADAEKQTATLLARDPAAHAALDDPAAVAWLLDALRNAGAAEQASLLADRATAHVALDDPGAIAQLLDALRKAGAEKQTATLLARDPAAHAAIDYRGGYALAALLSTLRNAGAGEQASVLADRAVAHAPLNDPVPVAWLLEELCDAGAKEQARTLVGRIAARAALNDPAAVTSLAFALRYVRWEEPPTALLPPDPVTYVHIDDPFAVAVLLQELVDAGEQEQVAALLIRDPATHATLDNPVTVAVLLEALLDAGAEEQAAALLARDPATHATLSHPYSAFQDPYPAARLLEALREAGAEEQARSLVDRLTVEGLFELFRKEVKPQTRYRFGREPDGRPAPPWSWNDLD